VISDEERHVLRGVPRSVECAQADVPHRDLVPVPHPDRLIETFTVGPIRPALVGDVHRCAGGGGQFARAREVVGVNVGLRHAHDTHVVLCGYAHVYVDVAARVDDDGFTFGLAADEVGRLGEVIVIDTFKQHENSLGLGREGNYLHVHRARGGTSASACSIWNPHP